MFCWGAKRKRRKALKELLKHTDYVLHADDDILTDKQKNDLRDLKAKTAGISADAPDAIEQARKLGSEFKRIVPPGKFAMLAEYADVLAVAVVVAFGIRAVFFQPFKIPTSSMQPTLFGIHYIKDNKTIDNCPAFLRYPLFSARKASLEVKESGLYDPSTIQAYTKWMIMDYTSFMIGNVSYTLPGAPTNVFTYLKFNPEYPKKMTKGQVLCDGWLSLGDHLFVDRWSMHLTGLNRGDVVVFNTEGVGPNGHLNGYYYIKRLAGMPGDTLQIRNNKLYVMPKGTDKFRPVNELSDKFNKLYSNQGGYHGHHNKFYNGRPANYLGSPDEILEVPEDCYVMLGDNSLFSSDSRDWGLVPRHNIVGRAMFVFWPFSRRWGVVDSAPALPVPTGTHSAFGFDAMSRQ